MSLKRSLTDSQVFFLLLSSARLKLLFSICHRQLPGFLLFNTHSGHVRINKILGIGDNDFELPGASPTAADICVSNGNLNEVIA